MEEYINEASSNKRKQKLSFVGGMTFFIILAVFLKLNNADTEELKNLQTTFLSFFPCIIFMLGLFCLNKIKTFFYENIIYESEVYSLKKEVFCKIDSERTGKTPEVYFRYIINEDIYIYGENISLEVSKRDNDCLINVNEFYLKDEYNSKVIKKICDIFLPTYSEKSLEREASIIVSRDLIEYKMYDGEVLEDEIKDSELKDLFLDYLKKTEFYTKLKNVEKSTYNYVVKKDVYEVKVFNIF